MNFQQLEYAIAVHREGQFGKAADQCNVTQATLSGMIIKLEDEIGFPIFDRTKRPIHTTEKGHDFIVKAKDIISIKKEMLLLGSQDDATLKGNLTIGVIPTVANTLIPLITEPLLRHNPELKLSIKELTTDEIVKTLHSDELDIGILATPLENELEETILYYEPMMVYGIESTSKGYLTSEDVKNQKIWLLEEGHCFRDQAMTLCNLQEKVIKEQRLDFRASTFDSLINMSNKLGGITLIPEMYFNNLSPTTQQKVKSFEKPIPVREISIVSHRPLSKQRTINHLSRLIKELVAPLLSTSQLKNQDMEIIGF